MTDRSPLFYSFLSVTEIEWTDAALWKIRRAEDRRSTNQVRVFTSRTVRYLRRSRVNNPPDSTLATEEFTSNILDIRTTNDRHLFATLFDTESSCVSDQESGSSIALTELLSNHPLHSPSTTQDSTLSNTTPTTDTDAVETEVWLDSFFLALVVLFGIWCCVCFWYVQKKKTKNWYVGKNQIFVFVYFFPLPPFLPLLAFFFFFALSPWTRVSEWLIEEIIVDDDELYLSNFVTLPEALNVSSCSPTSLTQSFLHCQEFFFGLTLRHDLEDWWIRLKRRRDRSYLIVFFLQFFEAFFQFDQETFLFGVGRFNFIVFILDTSFDDEDDPVRSTCFWRISLSYLVNHVSSLNKVEHWMRLTEQGITQSLDAISLCGDPILPFCFVAVVLAISVDTCWYPVVIYVWKCEEDSSIDLDSSMKISTVVLRSFSFRRFPLIPFPSEYVWACLVDSVRHWSDPIGFCVFHHCVLWSAKKDCFAHQQTEEKIKREWCKRGANIVLVKGQRKYPHID